jgi:hypothetical protein
MVDRSFLSWPFLEPRHEELHDRVKAWAVTNISTAVRRAPRPPRRFYEGTNDIQHLAILREIQKRQLG